MNNEKNNFLTVSWLSGLLSAEIFISTGEWAVQMPPLTSENSHFLRSGPQEATLVMLNSYQTFMQTWCNKYTHIVFAVSMTAKKYRNKFSTWNVPFQQCIITNISSW